MVSGLVCIIGSGIAARATLLTLAAATAVAIIPAPPRKLRLELVELCAADGSFFGDVLNMFIVSLIFNVRYQCPGASPPDAEPIDIIGADMGFPKSVACSAASACQNCCCAAMAALTVLI